jgi:hemerythrin-like domain-containing protein
LPDYGHDLLFGTFITPSNRQAPAVVALSQLSERAGLDLATFQDHPYQPGFLDTWTLMSYVAAQTQTIRLSGNVLNLPLRPPAVLARAAASLDILSGGRIELGLGAGALWSAIGAMGGRRLTPGQGVDALSEAIDVIRLVWEADARGVARLDGRYYQVAGAKRGPAPAHDMSIWLGAYKPRMLRLVGTKADGWLPSLGYIQPEDLGAGNKIIDDAALAAGRKPADIRRLLNVSGAVTSASQGFLTGPVSQWVEDLAGLALEYGISAFILSGDDPDMIQVLGQEIAPAVREAVASRRRGPAPGNPGNGGRREAEAAPSVIVSGGQPSRGSRQARDGGIGDTEYERLGVTPTPDDGARLSTATARLWDESTRPRRPESGPEVIYTDTGRRVGRHLIDVHDALRGELAEVREVIVKVKGGAMEAAEARSVLNEMTMRQNNWTMGAYCASYCRVVTQHHGLEDDAIFPYLRRREESLRPVIDRLAEEHDVIHKVIDDVDAALVELITHPDDYSRLQEAVDVLTDALLSHLAYEERELVEPLARHGFYANQV